MGFIAIGLDNGKTIFQDYPDSCIRTRLSLLTAILLDPKQGPTMGEISEPSREYEVEPMPVTIPITEPSPAPDQPATPEKEPVPVP